MALNQANIGRDPPSIVRTRALGNETHLGHSRITAVFGSLGLKEPCNKVAYLRMPKAPSRFKINSTGESGIPILSFFSGAGFLDLGFEAEGFEIFFTNEVEPKFNYAYSHSRKKMGLPLPKFGQSEQSIDSFLKDSDPTLKHAVTCAEKTSSNWGMIGGPPCPDFSVGGKNRGREGENGKLSQSYASLILEFKPGWFLFENVKGLWRTKKHREFYDQLKGQLEAGGYVLTNHLMNSIQFGAPQDRDRIFLFGVKKSLLGEHGQKIENFDWMAGAKYPDRAAFDYDWPGTSEFGGNPNRHGVPQELTVAYWFKKNSVSSHPNSRHHFTPRAALPRFQTIKEGDDKKKSFKRLHRHRYSPTACYGNNEVHLHPWLPRRISAAEALSIQTLPAQFELPADMTLSAMFKTIGNGVPFLLAKGIAQNIKHFFRHDI